MPQLVCNNTSATGAGCAYATGAAAARACVPAMYTSHARAFHQPLSTFVTSSCRRLSPAKTHPGWPLYSCHAQRHFAVGACHLAEGRRSGQHGRVLALDSGA